MKFRLFWKILFGFWLTFICIVVGIWVILTINGAPHNNPMEIEFERSFAEVQLASASAAFHLDGENGLLTLIESWPEKERLRLSYKRLPNKLPDGVITDSIQDKIVVANKMEKPDLQESRVYSRVEKLPDGTFIRLTYNTAKMGQGKKLGPSGVPPELVIIGILGGLIFSSLLAWYLIAPVWRLRMGFKQLTNGVLNVRLKPFMGRRRDEIADLARDFDLMAQRLQFLVESREQLLHDVSHELRSPLARQQVAIELARQIPPRTPELLDRIELETVRMDELVGELLILSRVESGEIVTDEYFDLQELARIIVNNSQFESEQDKIQIKLHSSTITETASSLTVRGDAELVRRALENVIRNAVRHSPCEASVDVTLFAYNDKKTCTITVEDHGPGVPSESLKQIFEPFVRLKKSNSHSTGLGLAIAKRAIVVHKGSIYAENRAGGGLSVFITLPLETSEVEESKD